MNLEIALELWRGSGYRRINGYLIQKHTGSRFQAYKYTGALAPNFEYDIEEVVNTLRNGMKPVSTSQIYYRGASSLFTTNCRVETFLSVSINKEDAESFANDGTVYEITLKEGVRGLKTGVEGELVLEDGCFWEYRGGNKVTIHSPSSGLDFGYCSSVIKRGGKRSGSKTKRKTRRNRK
jgi:hypothetical protein